MQQAGPSFINTGAAISVFFKPRLTGTRYLKEEADRAVITWSLTEPVGGIQDMTWTPTVNRFQAVLYKDGAIEFNYDEVHAEDAIVGMYPMVTQGNEKEIGAIDIGEKAAVPGHLNITSVKLAAVDDLFLKATLVTRGPVLAETDPAIMGLAYRVCLDRTAPAKGCTQDSDTVWTIQGGGGRGRGGAGTLRYNAVGPGLSPAVKVSGNDISIHGTLPAGFKMGDPIYSIRRRADARQHRRLSSTIRWSPHWHIKLCGHWRAQQSTSPLSTKKTAPSLSPTRPSTT